MKLNFAIDTSIFYQDIGQYSQTSTFYDEHKKSGSEIFYIGPYKLRLPIVMDKSMAFYHSSDQFVKQFYSNCENEKNEETRGQTTEIDKRYDKRVMNNIDNEKDEISDVVEDLDYEQVQKQKKIKIAKQSLNRTKSFDYNPDYNSEETSENEENNIDNNNQQQQQHLSTLKSENQLFEKENLDIFLKNKYVNSSIEEMEKNVHFFNKINHEFYTVAINIDDSGDVFGEFALGPGK